jgi:acetylornithine aminotransferase/acetylornithine/N-succinyldiaminopimelate aminotransferase
MSEQDSQKIREARPALTRKDAAAVKAMFERNVIPTYGRFDLVLSHGAGSYVYDLAGKRYLDFGAGIAVSCLGHCHPAITEALSEQSRRLIHVSNYYYHEPQGRLAQGLVQLLGPGKCFFCTSGGEANEGLFKLARKFGHEEGRFEILTARNSFHGRTLAGISATGQEKVKKGFEPMVAGFRLIPYNDLEAVRAALSPATAAILIECIQGEGGVTPATPDYLLGLRQLCDQKKLLLLVDGVQDGHFRTGRFQGFQRILEGVPEGEGFRLDGLSMAKSLGGGLPIGAFWVRAPYADLLGPGTHGSTYGGSPLACAVALRILEVIQREKLEENARQVGDFLASGLRRISERFPGVIGTVRGLGLMLGMELAPGIANLPGDPNKTQSARLANLLHGAGLLTIPAGGQVLRVLPPLNLRQTEAREGLDIIETVCQGLG